jgi:hypothetical protein
MQRSPQTGRRFFVAPRRLDALVDRLIVVDDAEGRLRPAWVEEVDDGTSGGHGVVLVARFADAPSGVPADGDAVRVGGRQLVLGGESKALREQLDAQFMPPRRGLNEALDARDEAASGDPASLTAAAGDGRQLILPDGEWVAVGVFEKAPAGGAGSGSGAENLFVGRVAGFDAASGLFSLHSGRRALLASGAGFVWLRATAPAAHPGSGGPGAVRALLCADTLPAAFPLAVGAGVLADCGEGVLRAGAVHAAFDAAAGEYSVMLEAVPASALPPAAAAAAAAAGGARGAGLPARVVRAGLASLCLTAKGAMNFAALGRARLGPNSADPEPRVAVAPRENPRKAKRALGALPGELAQPLVPIAAHRSEQARTARDRDE